MVKKCWWVWCKFSQQKKSNRIYSWSWSWISWRITCIPQWFPLAPEKIAISYDILSDYCKKIADEHEIKVGDVEKLLKNLGN